MRSGVLNLKQKDGEAFKLGSCREPVSGRSDQEHTLLCHGSGRVAVKVANRQLPRCEYQLPLHEFRATVHTAWEVPWTGLYLNCLASDPSIIIKHSEPVSHLLVRRSLERAATMSTETFLREHRHAETLDDMWPAGTSHAKPPLLTLCVGLKP